MLLLLPVFLALLLGFVEFSTIVVMEERLEAASAQGARVASQGGSVSDVQTAVFDSLGPGPLQNNLMMPITIIPSDPTSAVSGAPVTVRLEVTANLVVPDLLRYIGYSISNQVLVGQSVMRKE
jgi:Flp pilus assembly protein TadG